MSEHERDGGAPATATGGGGLPVPVPAPHLVERKLTPKEIVGAPVPSRDRKVRNAVVRLYERLPHLCPADVEAVTRLAHLYKLIRSAEQNLEDKGLTRQDDEPRKFGWLYLAMMKEARDLEAVLGITAAARAKLGVEVVRMRRLARDGDLMAQAQDARDRAAEDVRDHIVENDRGEMRLDLSDDRDHMRAVAEMILEYVGVEEIAAILAKRKPGSVVTPLVGEDKTEDTEEPSP